jgi:ABC-type transport system involved in cytochrome c biogenesis permease subunit
MLFGIKFVCFAASYAVALALEVSRLFFRSGVRGAVMLGFAAAGLLAHTVFLCYRVLDFYKTYEAANPNASPLSSNQDWYLIAAWLLVVVYLHLTCFHPKVSFGLFLLPLVLALVGVAFVADPQPFPREPASRVWGMIHGTAILLASVAVLVGLVAGLMYLWQARRLKHKVPAQKGLRLPSLEWLQRANSRAIVIALTLVGIGILAGMILNATNRGRDVGSVPWNDPVILSTLMMFGWLAGTSGIGLVYRPAREGRRVACLTVVSFLFLVIALGFVLLDDTQHGGVGSRRRSESRVPPQSEALELPPAGQAGRKGAPTQPPAQGDGQ